VSPQANIDLPSGEIFEVLSKEYKFHLDNGVVKRHLEELGKTDSKRCEEDTLCRFNSKVAMDFGMREAATSWQQLADIAHQVDELRAKILNFGQFYNDLRHKHE
jgi:hypothetical protein